MTVRGTVALVFLLCICGLTEQRPFFFFSPTPFYCFCRDSQDVSSTRQEARCSSGKLRRIGGVCERRFLITMIVCLNQTTRKNSRRHSEQHKSNLQQLLIPLTLSLPLSLVLFFSSLSLFPYDFTSPSSCVAITQTSPLKK